MHIPLLIHGVTSYFNVRKPMQEEYDTCGRYEATYETPDWNPHSPSFSEQEDVMVDLQGDPLPNDALGSRGRRLMVSGVHSSSDPSPSIHDLFADALEQHRQISQVKIVILPAYLD